MPRRLALATAALAVTLGAASATAAGLSTAAAEPVPGPKVPIEHVGFSGAQFNVRSGTPRCFTGAGSAGLGYPVPAGATVLGLSAYVIDGQPGSIAIELSRHDFTSGASYQLAKANSVNGNDTVVELEVDPGYVVRNGEGVNVVVTIPSGTCFKGAVLHYLPGPAPATTSQLRTAPDRALAQDGSATG